MLTKQDLQNIRGVLQEEIKASVPLIVKGELKTSVPLIVQEEIKASVPLIVQEEITASVPLIVKGELKPIKRKLNRLEKDVRYIVKDFDERIVANTRAIQKLQNN